LVGAKVRERLAVSKRAAQSENMERFNQKKINEEAVKEECQVAIMNKFTAVENLEDSGDISRTWDAITENMKFSAKEDLGNCELEHRKTWLDEKY
jgi:hypothetical protein